MRSGAAAAALLALLAVARTAASPVDDAAELGRKVGDVIEGQQAVAAIRAWGNINATIASSSNSGGSTQARKYTKRCGTQPPTADEEAGVANLLHSAELFEDEEYQQRRLPSSQTGSQARLLDNNFGPLIKQVKVYWHVIQKGQKLSDGHLGADQINRQITVLNQKLRKANFQFTLAGVDYTTNAEWFAVAQNSATEEQMKRKLHKGTLQDFNVYSASPTDSEGNQVAGFTKLPMFVQNDIKLDGSVILYDSLPGGTQYGLDMGMTLVHECGHWLGLLHTFDNGCNVPGDGVGDTPYEATASFDCKPKNTCSESKKATKKVSDPIHNPMNYSPDSCMTQFTTMQCRRMRQQWYAFRAQRVTA